MEIIRSKFLKKQMFLSFSEHNPDKWTNLTEKPSKEFYS